MKLLVIGSGMMGSAAAFDMARTPQVSSVTLADSDAKVREKWQPGSTRLRATGRFERLLSTRAMRRQQPS